MYSSTSFWIMIVSAALMLSGNPRQVVGQAQSNVNISLSITSQAPLSAVEKGSRRIVLRDAKGVRAGLLIAKQGRRILSLAGQADVSLPYDLPAIVSTDGTVVVQYGDTQDLSHPRVTHFYWLGGQGKERGRLEGYFRADAVIGLSDDGFTAIAGSRTEAPHVEVLSLFDPSGQRVWERPLEPGRDITTEPKVALRGERVVAVTRDAEKSLKDRWLMIFDKNNKEVKRIGTLGRIQKMVIVDRSESLFIQGRERYGLIQLSNGNIAWTRPGNIRLISPSGATMSADGTLLFLLLADWTGRPQNVYPWRLRAVDASNGQERGMVAMPKPMAGTRADLFGRIGMDEVEIITDADRFTISIGR